MIYLYCICYNDLSYNNLQFILPLFILGMDVIPAYTNVYIRKKLHYLEKRVSFFTSSIISRYDVMAVKIGIVSVTVSVLTLGDI